MITKSQLNEAFGFSMEQWQGAKAEARNILIENAKKAQLIEYSELTRQIHSIKFDPHETVFRRFLGQLSWEEDAAGRGMITAIVVHKSDHLPGGGFFELAGQLGRDVSDRLGFWSAEVNRVFADWTVAPVRQDRTR